MRSSESAGHFTQPGSLVGLRREGLSVAEVDQVSIVDRAHDSIDLLWGVIAGDAQKARQLPAHLDGSLFEALEIEPGTPGSASESLRFEGMAEPEQMGVLGAQAVAPAEGVGDGVGRA